MGRLSKSNRSLFRVFEGKNRKKKWRESYTERKKMKLLRIGETPTTLETGNNKSRINETSTP